MKIENFFHDNYNINNKITMPLKKNSLTDKPNTLTSLSSSKLKPSTSLGAGLNVSTLGGLGGIKPLESKKHVEDSNKHILQLVSDNKRFHEEFLKIYKKSLEQNVIAEKIEQAVLYLGEKMDSKKKLQYDVGEDIIIICKDD